MAPDSPVDGAVGHGPIGKFSCVVDADPRFHLDVLRWYATLRSVVGVDPSDLVVHAVGGCRSEILDYVTGRGVVVRDVDPFDERSPHCNKISGIRDLAVMGVQGLAVLTDTDVVVLEDPRALDIGTHSVASKPVGRPHPSLAVLRTVFTTAELPLPALWPVDKEPGTSTLAGNGNGGVYLVPGSILPAVAEAWERWARWLLERTDLLGQWSLNVDQVSMAMALSGEGIEPQQLEGRWNYPTHEKRLPAISGPPAIIHYHQKVDTKGLLLHTGQKTIDRQIDRANAAITETRREASPVATFWDWRYATNPSLGSGTGSRGKPLVEKRELLSALLEVLHPQSVLDVGCGDGEATRDLTLPDYVGIDVSSEAVRTAQSTRPDGDYRVGALADQDVQAELTLCLDVLIHQPDPDQYRDLVKSLLAATTRALLVSGFEEAPATDSAAVHFYQPLSTTLRELAPEAELYPLGKVHNATVVLALMVPKDVHPRDYPPSTLALIAKRHPDLLRLISMRTSAWETIGFFPNHAPRLWEYPTAADRLIGQVNAGGRIVDIGAGVNPLVPYLAARGYEVDTVDPSPQTREWPPKPDWTGWGFLDYAAIGMGHKSWNCPLDELPVDPKFDAAYSISVIEHLTAADRRLLLLAIAERVRTGGVVILTVDLGRDSNDLWNQAQGRPVEPVRHHGTMRSLVGEVKQVGFEVTDVQTVRHWGDVPIDIGLLVLRRTARPAKPARAPTALASVRPQLASVAHKAVRRVRSRLH